MRSDAWIIGFLRLLVMVLFVCVGTDLVEEVYLSEYCVCLFQSLAKAFIYF